MIRTFNKTWLYSVINEVTGEVKGGDKFLVAEGIKSI